MAFINTNRQKPAQEKIMPTFALVKVLVRTNYSNKNQEGLCQNGTAPSYELC